MKYSYKAPCRKEKLQDIRSFVKEVLNKHNLTGLDVSTVVLAIDEVCANLIIHTHQCNPKESIKVEIKVLEGNKWVFNIIDNAEMFDINRYEEPKLDDIIKKQRKGGIGLILVKKIMDDIQIITKKNQHICRLVKTIDTP